MGTSFVVRRLYTPRTTNMNSIAIILSLAAMASASVVPYAFPGSVAVRAPSHDSAIIQSHRLGGNFAYRTDEAHAYAVQTPVLGQRTIPVGVSYHQGTPIVKTTTDYVSHFVPQTGIATYQAPAQVIAQPIVPMLVPIMVPMLVPTLMCMPMVLVVLIPMVLVMCMLRVLVVCMPMVSMLLASMPMVCPLLLLPLLSPLLPKNKDKLF